MNAKKKKVLEALQNNAGNITKACEDAGFAVSSFYNWKNTDEEFRKAVEEIDNVQFAFVEGKLLELVDNLNPTAVIFYLKTKGKDRGYKETSEVKLDTKEFEIKVE